MDLIHAEARKEYNSFLKKGCTAAFKSYGALRAAMNEDDPDWLEMTQEQKEELAGEKRWHASGDGFCNYLGNTCIADMVRDAKNFKALGKDLDDDVYIETLSSGDEISEKRMVRGAHCLPYPCYCKQCNCNLWCLKVGVFQGV